FRSRCFVDRDVTWRFLDRMTEPPDPRRFATRLPASIFCRDHLRSKRLNRPSQIANREDFRSPPPGGPMLEPRRMKVKVCLVGEHAVGKTSPIKRYVLNEYDDRYIVTLGAKVSKKELTLNPKGGDAIQMDMTIWDIMGSKGLRGLLREAYFHGAQGILAVADITRDDTLEYLDSWVESVCRTVGVILVVFSINKIELKDYV